jgi:ectoine hydroxylase-related dioxygenase (phytanoyl-CoA dioxygenase family)
METVYHEKGYYLAPDVFSKEEIATIKCKVLEQQGSESDNFSVKSLLHGVDPLDPLFKSLAELPRLLIPVTKILNGAPTYLYQGRVIFKKPFGGDNWPWHGDVWPWHQDFTYFKNESGIKNCDLVMCIIYLDDNTEFNSPLLVIEGSHKNGIIDVPTSTEATRIWKENFGREIKFVLGEKELSPLLEKGSMVSVQGKAGSVLFVHPSIVHASSINLSPYTRTNLFLIYNDINNKPDPNKAKKSSSQEIHALELSDTFF